MACWKWSVQLNELHDSLVKTSMILHVVKEFPRQPHLVAKRQHPHISSVLLPLSLHGIPIEMLKSPGKKWQRKQHGHRGPLRLFGQVLGGSGDISSWPWIQYCLIGCLLSCYTSIYGILWNIGSIIYIRLISCVCSLFYAWHCSLSFGKIVDYVSCCWLSHRGRTPNIL